MIDIFFTIIMIEMEPETRLLSIAGQLGFKIKDVINAELKGGECAIEDKPMLINKMTKDTYMGQLFKVTYDGKSDVHIIIVEDGIFYEGSYFKFSDYKFIPKCAIDNCRADGTSIIITTKHKSYQFIAKDGDLDIIKKTLRNMKFKLPLNVPKLKLGLFRNMHEAARSSFPMPPIPGGRRKTKRAKKNKRRTRRS
jgi:hypothetical protein